MLNKVLIDTNIIIGLEDNKEVNVAYSEMLALCGKHGVSIRIHESSKADIERDKDSGRKAITLSKLKKYQVLSKTPRSKEEKEKIFGKIKSPNDDIDTDLLVSLEIGVVDILVTEDKELAKRVSNNPLGERVFTVNSALFHLKALFEAETVEYPHVVDKTCNQLDTSDSFFDSLRTDYDDFNNWLASCVRKERECWCIESEKKLGGLIIYKKESTNNPDEAKELHDLGVPGNQVLKICLFKMGDDMRGGKYGEQLLKKSMDHGFRNSFDSMYLTTYERQEELIKLIQKFGFIRGNDKGKERVYYKFCKPTVDEIYGIDFHKKYWPAIRAINQSFYIVPVKPNFHDRLFPEITHKFSPQLSLDLSLNRESLIPGNAIRKVYVSQSNIKEMNPGSILLFYRSSDSCLTSVGVLESFTVVNDMQAMKAAVGIRSVYRDDELSGMISGAKSAKVLNFYYSQNLEEHLSFSEMLGKGILKGAPQSISRLDGGKLMAALHQLDKGVFFEK